MMTANGRKRTVRKQGMEKERRSGARLRLSSFDGVGIAEWFKVAVVKKTHSKWSCRWMVKQGPSEKQSGFEEQDPAAEGKTNWTCQRNTRTKKVAPRVNERGRTAAEDDGDRNGRER
jgi:hypothetical protein